ncbi:MAG: hypothetical protein U0Q19_10140 [Kineosporiaceae bacterium]
MTTNQLTDRPTGQQPRPGVLARVLRALPALTLLAVLTITASAEYALARTVLDLPPQIAWALPAAIDSYVLAALHTRRDVPAAITVMAGALLASMGAHLAQVGRTNHLPVTWTAPLATAIMTVLVIVAWRVHVLIAAPAMTEPEPGAEHVHLTVTTEPPTADAEGVPVLGQAAVSTPRPSTPALGTPSTGTPSTGSPASTPEAMPRPGGEYTSSPSRAQPAPSVLGMTGPGTPRALDAGAPPGRAAPAVPSSVTDEQILAAITGPPPSIRALKREHGIGQSRASRLHRLAQQKHAQQLTNNHEDTSHHMRNTQSQNEENQESETEEQERKTEEQEQKSKNENPTTAPEIEPEECRTKDEEESHTCITDRVGPSRSTPLNSSDHDHEISVVLEVAR